MNILDIIAKKRDGHALNQAEIEWFINEYVAERIADYQAAAWLMAVYLNGMSREETVNLTMAMVNSGETLDLSDVVDFAVDKHSSGGVGDKTSLVVLPIVAACGIPIAKMSGRGLGHTGGTLDKLESITGYRTNLDSKEFKRITGEFKLVLAGQSGDLAPADKKLYALRDVTSTVSSIPLIASSIMSKKIAAGADGVVLDVKTGKGAFMETVDSARELAQTMVNIGVDAGKRMVALISDMNQPLGYTAGNALEVKEAVLTLRNDSAAPEDFREHCLVAAAQMLRVSGGATEMKEARSMAELALVDGSALAKFIQMVDAQGGNTIEVEQLDLLPQASIEYSIFAEKDSYIQELDALAVGQAVLELGGGRRRKDDAIDHAVGVVTHVKIGDKVTPETPVFSIHANDETSLNEAKKRLANAAVYSDEVTPRLPLFYDVLEGGLA